MPGLAAKLAAQKAAKEAAGLSQQPSEPGYQSQQQGSYPGNSSQEPSQPGFPSQQQGSYPNTSPHQPSQPSFPSQQQGSYAAYRPPQQQQPLVSPSSPYEASDALQPPQTNYPTQQQQQQYQQQLPHHLQPQQTTTSTRQQGNAKFQRYKELLQHTIDEKKLQHFYPPANPSRLDEATKVVCDHMEEVCSILELDEELAMDLAKLALFDIVLYIDNSGSMKINKDRIVDLHVVMSQVVNIVRLFDADGIDVRFMNDDNGRKSRDNVRDSHTIKEILAQEKMFIGVTPLGTQLRIQILEKVVFRAKAGQLPKPILVITITDGVPYGESPNTTLDGVIKWAISEVARTPYGSGSLSFEFAQVGNDEDAQNFLEKLDEDPSVGHLIDTTSNYEIETAQVLAKSGVELEPAHWILKILVGAIDSSYDEKDEGSSRMSSHNAAGYGQPTTYQAPAAQSYYGSQAPNPGYNQQQNYSPHQGYPYPDQGGGYPNTFPSPGGYQGGYPPSY